MSALTLIEGPPALEKAKLPDLQSTMAKPICSLNLRLSGLRFARLIDCRPVGTPFVKIPIHLSKMAMGAR